MMSFNRRLLILLISTPLLSVFSRGEHGSIGIVSGTTIATKGNVAVEDEDSYRYHPATFVKSFKAFRNELLLGGEVEECRINASDKSASGNDRVSDRPTNVENKLIVAAVQLSSSPSSSNDASSFFHRAVESIEKAVVQHNATLVLLQELFLGPYFCQSQDAELFELAEELPTREENTDTGNDSNDNPFLKRLRELASRLNVVLPISMYERRNNAHYNSVAMIDADGTILGTYRKSHIPDGTGYQEKFYFTPGDTGFRVFRTKVGKVGVGICWDQWFPEAARSMALLGADVLLYPTAIGSEPQDPTLNSADHWQRVMQGHAAANMVPVVASNRIGTEILMNEDGTEKQRITFYGRSFITDETGAIIREAKPGVSDIITSEIDTETNRLARVAWGLFRDRRPELYGVLRTKDGQNPM